MSIHVTRFSSLEGLTEATVKVLSQHLCQPVDHPYAVMLSGGKTPLEAYQRLVRGSIPASGSLHLLWSDERLVSNDSPLSNLGNTRELITALGIPAGRLLSVRTDLPLHEAATDYHHQIQTFLDQGGTLPLGLLGLGADGHTASLFSLEDAAKGEGIWAIPVKRATPPDRVSVTSGLLSRFRRLLFLVAGEDKREVLRKLEDDPESIPAGRAVRDAAQVEVWCWLGEGSPMPSPRSGKDAY